MSTRKNWFLFFIIISATLLIYNQIISWLLLSWTMNPYLNYGILVPFLSLYLIYRKRNELSKTKRQYDGSGIYIVVLALLIYMINILLVKWISLYIFLIGNLVIFHGKKRVKKIAPSLLFLLLATPVPDYILEFVGLGLKQISVSLSVWMISLITDVNIINDTIYLNDVSFYVGMPCSGLESFLGFGIFAVFFAQMFEKGKRKVILVASCLVATIIFNSLRMFTIFYSAILFGEDVAMGIFHTFSGMVMVSIYTIILLFVYRRRI